MSELPCVLGSWDYFWIHCDAVVLATASSDKELIRAYCCSPAFHTSFLPPEGDETGIHGPFRADQISHLDFVSLKPTDLKDYLNSLEVAGIPEEDEAARETILTHLLDAFGEDRSCYALKADERNAQFFHEWGFVLTVFREFLFIGPARNTLERFIVGYD